MPRSPEPARRRLLDAARRLFADRGIDATTVTAITAAAGQGNNSAVAYHFGSKAGLLDAVLDEHLAAVDDRRADLLAELTADGRALTAADLAAIVVRPLVACLDDPDGPAHLRIMGDLLDHRGPTSTGPVRTGLTDAHRAARHLPAVDDDRRLLIVTTVFHGLSAFAAQHPDADAARRDAFADLLVTTVTRLLTPRTEGT